MTAMGWGFHPQQMGTALQPALGKHGLGIHRPRVSPIPSTMTPRTVFRICSRIRFATWLAPRRGGTTSRRWTGK